MFMSTLELGIESGKSLIYKEKSTGPKIDPSGNPRITISASDS